MATAKRDKQVEDLKSKQEISIFSIRGQRWKDVGDEDSEIRDAETADLNRNPFCFEQMHT